jgi:hypothetical protein
LEKILEENQFLEAKASRKISEAIRDWAFLEIEAKEFIFILLSFLDAKLTSICLSLGGYEAMPWMKGWGANAGLRMAVAASIMLYLKMRGLTRLLWFGIMVLFIIVIWNCAMVLILWSGEIHPLYSFP